MRKTKLNEQNVFMFHLFKFFEGNKFWKIIFFIINWFGFRKLKGKGFFFCVKLLQLKFFFIFKIKTIRAAIFFFGKMKFKVFL